MLPSLYLPVPSCGTLSPATEGSVVLGALAGPKVELKSFFSALGTSWRPALSKNVSLIIASLIDLPHFEKEPSIYLNASEHCSWRVSDHKVPPSHLD